MAPEQLQKLKYPIGQFQKPETITSEHITTWINDIEAFPNRLISLTDNLSIEELQYRHRPEGWMIKQVVHHCVDSHINCIIRFKLALTEDTPTIRPYYEDRWATLIDYNDNDLTDSLMLLTSLHSKLGKLIRNISKEDLKREFIHPEHGSRVRLDENIGVYAWHGNHHLAHIAQAIEYKEIFNF